MSCSSLSAAADDEGGLSEALLGNAPHLDSDHSGSSRSGGDDGDMFFSDECGTRPPSSATSEHVSKFVLC